MPDWQMDASLQSAMGLGEQGGAASTSSSSAAAIGARGVAGASTALPHGDVIQRSFGHHDISGIKAHLGGEAAAASQQLGAEAYATGQSVAFAGAPSLHTAAHEAAHVVQQQAGIQLKGGLGEEGDAHEQHADAVADAVVAGRSAEPLLDRYTGGGGGSGPAPAAAPTVQRKPVKDKDADERHYHDDKHPKLKLIKEPSGEENEYRLKDRVQQVYWRDASNYFTDKALKQPLDLTQLEATREFGSFLETFQEASVMEHEEDAGSEAASMHLLQQFFSNALFDASEVERFDYQASPLNYQGEHTYIRAAATGNADVMKDQLLGKDFEMEAYLASRMDFRDTLHQMFRAITIEEEPTEGNLRGKLAPLADGIATHVAARFAKKTEFEAANKEARDQAGKEAASLKGKISNLESSLGKQRRDTLDNDADTQLFDWGAQKDEYVRTQRELDKEKDVRAKIAELDKQIQTAATPQPSTATPQPSSATPQPATTSKKKQAPKLDPATQKGNLERSLARLDGEANRKKLEELAAKLGIDLEAFKAFNGDTAGANLDRLQLAKARSTKTPYGEKFGQLEELKHQLTAKNAEIEEIEKRRFDLMRDFDKSFGGLAFIDFTALLEGQALDKVPGLLEKWGAMATKVLVALIEAALPGKSVASSDVVKIMAELKKAKTLSRAYFAGGMQEVKNNGLTSPTLFLEKNDLAMPVRTALGKSGYVPTPTAVNRQMLQGGVSLKDIVLGVIDKQLERQAQDKEQDTITKAKLAELRKLIEAFDPETHERAPADPGQLAATQAAYKPFCKLADHEEEHVGLMVRPVIQLFDNLGILSGKIAFPAFALRQLETHLQDAVADAADIVALQRSVQNLHEFVVYGLELSKGEPASPASLPLPDGAQAAHVTHYGLNAFSHAFEGVLKQKTADGGGGLAIAALNNIYFEMMQKLGYTQGASGGGIQLAQPSSPAELMKGLKPASGTSVKVGGPDMIVIDIHPNDASKREIHQHDVAGLLHQLFGAADKTFRCTVLVDITLNHISEDEVANIRNEARPYIDSGQLNLVFNQSLTKFAQFGTDKHSGGLMFHYNDGKHWEAFNAHVEACAKDDRVDPTIQKYFMALFEHTQKENLDYLQKVRLNSRYVYEKLQEQLATISCQEALTLAGNDDPKTCYVAFNYDAFAAKVLGPTADDNQVRQMASDILFECINELAGKLSLPLNMRTSFGFPISNLGDIDPGIRLTVGIESQELLDRYVQLLTFANGALGRELDTGGAAKLKDPEQRRTFLREITATIKTLADLDEQIKAMQGGKGAKPTALPPSAQSLPKKQLPGAPSTTTALRGERIDVGIGAVPHIQNSCYIASLINLFAASPAYRDMIQQNRPPPQVPDGPAVEPSQVQVLCQRLDAAITALRTPGEHVTEAMIRDVRDTLRALGWLQAPDVVVPKTATPDATPKAPTTVIGSTGTPDVAPKSPAPVTVPDATPKSGTASAKPLPSSGEALVAQQDAAEILQKLLGALNLPATMTMGEQGRKKQAMDADFVNHNPLTPTGLIQLPISAPNVTTLEQALKKYCAVEQVENWGEKLITFRALPRTLTIALKRFDFLNYRAAKNYRRLEVPQEFVMPNECLHPALDGQQFRYKVVSFVEHQGAYGGGHYIAHAKHADGRGYRNDDLQDGTRKESEQELNESLARSYLYVFEQVVDAL